MAGSIGRKGWEGGKRTKSEGREKEGKKTIFLYRAKPAREQSIQLNIF